MKVISFRTSTTDLEFHLIQRRHFFLSREFVVKAARQGSSVGCYSVTEKDKLSNAVNDAFGFSDQVLVAAQLRRCVTCYN